MIKKISFWIENARYVALPQSITPAILALSMAFGKTNFSIWLSIIALLGVILTHLGMNLADDYFDYLNGDVNRRQKAKEGMRIRIAKCDYLSNNQTSINNVLKAVITFLFLALICGGVIFYFRGINLLWIIITTGVIGLSYSFPFLRLSYRGMGEIVIGLIFGPLLMIGIYYASCSRFSLDIFLMSIVIALLVINILFSHSVMDVECDKSISKTTLPQLLKTKTNITIASSIFCFLPFIIIAIGSLFIFPKSYLLVFICFPIALKLFSSLRNFSNGINSKLTPKWYLGRMENWDKITQGGIDWFMFRWYMARNLVVMFCSLLIIINIINSILK